MHTTVETSPGARLANFRYAAPEQCTGDPCDHRADVYSLGLILNEMITGELAAGTSYTAIAE